MRNEKPKKEIDCGVRIADCGMKSTEKMTNENHNVIPTEVGI